MELFNTEYILHLIFIVSLGWFIITFVDLILDFGLLGSSLKQKWKDFLNSKDSGWKLFLFSFISYLIFINMFNFLSPLYCISDDIDKDLVKGTIEANNIKISGL